MTDRDEELEVLNNYGVSPEEDFEQGQCEICHETELEISHTRHHSLLTPRDFDVSPYFEIIKPTIERGFDYRQHDWSNSVVQPPSQVAQ